MFNRTTEVILAFPTLILILLLVTGLGTALWLIVVAVGVTSAPRIARIVRGATLEIRERGFVEVARARGERESYILARELLPNILGPIGVDFGIRLAGSIVLIASLSFLGFGLQPPAADWGLIVSENRDGFTVQPWAAVGPIVAIGLLTIGLSLIVDGVRRGRAAIGEREPASDEAATAEGMWR
jgi:peptide/nickel transport system permease protein